MSLHWDKATQKYKISFRLGGRQFKYSLKHADTVLAEETDKRVGRTLRDLQEGRLVLPEGADVVEFVKSDGKRAEPLQAPDRPLTLGQLFAVYAEKLTRGAKAGNTMNTDAVHGRHLVRVLGDKRTLSSLTAAGEIQAYIKGRLEETYVRNGEKRSVTAGTVKKEVQTLATVWRWAHNQGHTKVQFPESLPKKLVFPKGEQRSPFQTWEQIERRIGKRKLSPANVADLWESLFLDATQVDEVLDHVEKSASEPWIYSAFLFVAHTGARRSEMLRAEIDDFDWTADEVLIRERKRRKGKLTFRHVPLTRRMREHFRKQTAGRFAVAVRPDETDRVLAKTSGDDADQVEAYIQWAARYTWFAIKEVLKGSKWEVLHGYHVFRHSYISNLASKGVDQRQIDAIVGHETEAMRQRYRHLFPKDQAKAVSMVFER